MIRPLGLAGIPCALFSEPNDFVRSSKFATYALDRADATKDPQGLLKLLCDFARYQREKPVLFYATDADLLFVSRFREQLSEYFRFVVADAELVETLENKSRFQKLAEKLGLPVPSSQPISPKEQSPDVLELRLPIILKPAEREVLLEPGAEPVRDAVGEDVKCVSFACRRELEAAWPRLAAIGVDFIAQEMIPGPESLIESYHAYVDETGALVAAFTGRKVRTYREKFGYSTVLETTDAADVATLGEELVSRIGVTGVVKLDFKRRPDGSLGLLEVNPRFSLWQHLGTKAGVDFMSLVFNDLTDKPRGPIAKAKPGVIYCRLRDFRAAREQGIPILKWIPWMLRTDAKEIAFDDLRPAFKRVQIMLSERLFPARH